MEAKFDKKWKAKSYIFWLKIKNRFKYGKMTLEDYGINYEISTKKYSVLQLVWTKKLQAKFDKIVEEELRLAKESGELNS